MSLASSKSNVLGSTYLFTLQIIYLTCLQYGLLLKNTSKEDFLPPKITPQLQAQSMVHKELPELSTDHLPDARYKPKGKVSKRRTLSVKKVRELHGGISRTGAGSR